MAIPLPRRLIAEAAGSALVAAVVVGSGAAAQRLAVDPAVALLANALATAGGLAAAILLAGPVSGGHLNPAVSLADWWLGRKTRTGLGGRELGCYAAAQLAGAALGALLGNLMYGGPLAAWSATRRDGGGLAVAEAVATAGLVALVAALARSRRGAVAPAAVAAYVASAYWFTSSTGFANPALTLARTLVPTYAGIAPASVPVFLLAQAAGLVAGVALARALYPRAADLVLAGKEAG